MAVPFQVVSPKHLPPLVPSNGHPNHCNHHIPHSLPPPPIAPLPFPMAFPKPSPSGSVSDFALKPAAPACVSKHSTPPLLPPCTHPPPPSLNPLHHFHQ